MLPLAALLPSKTLEGERSCPPSERLEGRTAYRFTGSANTTISYHSTKYKRLYHRTERAGESWRLSENAATVMKSGFPWDMI